MGLQCGRASAGLRLGISESNTSQWLVTVKKLFGAKKITKTIKMLHFSYPMLNFRSVSKFLRLKHIKTQKDLNFVQCESYHPINVIKKRVQHKENVWDLSKEIQFLVTKSGENQTQYHFEKIYRLPIYQTSNNREATLDKGVRRSQEIFLYTFYTEKENLITPLYIRVVVYYTTVGMKFPRFFIT